MEFIIYLIGMILIIILFVFNIKLFFEVRDIKRQISFSKELKKVKFDTARIVVPLKKNTTIESEKSEKSILSIDYSQRGENGENNER